MFRSVNARSVEGFGGLFQILLLQLRHFADSKFVPLPTIEAILEVLANEVASEDGGDAIGGNYGHIGIIVLIKRISTCLHIWAMYWVWTRAALIPTCLFRALASLMPELPRLTPTSELESCTFGIC
jgi:hypothetical protein